jgi:hypothetical protein
MRKLLLAGVLLFAAFPVQGNGSVILRWRSRSGASLYGRYVSDRRFCKSGEIITFASVPAVDKSCNVKKCVWKVRGGF